MGSTGSSTWGRTRLKPGVVRAAFLTGGSGGNISQAYSGCRPKSVPCSFRTKSSVSLLCRLWAGLFPCIPSHTFHLAPVRTAKFMNSLGATGHRANDSPRTYYIESMSAEGWNTFLQLSGHSYSLPLFGICSFLKFTWPRILVKLNRKEGPVGGT